MGAEFSQLQAPEQASAPVTLNVYNLGKSSQLTALNNALQSLGTGIFHCGVEVYDREWSYDGFREGTGVFCCRARRCQHHTYSESVAMGQTKMSQTHAWKLIRLLENQWEGSSYDLLRRNCTHFCDTFCQYLGVGPIPSRVTNLAKVGRAVADATSTGLLCCSISTGGCSKETIAVVTKPGEEMASSTT
mmetsp:Transcript_4563/g.12841  ORF Transcript_4563/g.12841 Transcript_4563/m.12841 type:complete len:189 (-) Transcript_4563:142-708(-)|eukprot:CAMPEP_0179300322 /NCGR_PEP_ID=MMETSP0797-20121207/46971_1 /TAXON_ID=47934 /ORGANISM="Dinophysis acuminata, Strain DAEP01" /LENGTH=188 /DNA_ID=CAMNT_0021009781 /DNA_START=44 /DNA_END=610 /DNA_ORIENTATION=+